MRKLSSYTFFQSKQIENLICILHKSWDLDEIFQDMFRAFVVCDSLIVIAYSSNFKSTRKKRLISFHQTRVKIAALS